MQAVEKKVWDLVQPVVQELGLRLVRVRLSGGDRHSTLQLMIEPEGKTRDNRLAVTLDQCSAVSRQVSTLLDVEDPIQTAYSLEVSSTGAERPLVTLADYQTYAPHRVKVELVAPQDGRRRFEAILEGTEGETLQLRPTDAPDTVMQVAYTHIRQGRLAFSPDELKQFLKVK